MGFLSILLMIKLNVWLNNVNQQNKHCTTPPSQQTFIKHFYRNRIHYNYKLGEKILKTLIQINILPTDPNKKKLIIYYDEFKTSNLLIKIIPLPRLEFWKKKRYISI